MVIFKNLLEMGDKVFIHRRHLAGTNHKLVFKYGIFISYIKIGVVGEVANGVAVGKSGVFYHKLVFLC